MKRLLLAGVVAGAALAGAAPANATIVMCDGAPVMVRCYWVGGGTFCDVYVATRPVVCVRTAHLVGPIGS